ncbi:hypothetical protein [Limimaricola cinnabarinus]|jgi:hypothetical protein|uniref:Lipoprotein n=1 Tax=Limimaricola cinnabarinus TaxID=1125964 RepID=A0A2G1MIB9_9RHOB|nr:hypothetical protein [Limimaricola cinnabarinus]PHP28447.1 hypothetical protein CJ301_06890 [Limimaricola cinnabarinus]
MRVGIKIGGVLAALMLAGCADFGPRAMPLLESVALPPVLPPDAELRALPEPEPFAAEYTENPFEMGPVSVIAPDRRGAMATWQLIPCREGRAICVDGHAGQLSVAGETYVVSGVHGMSFHLMTGGEGFVTRSGGGKFADRQVPLAWEHVPAIEPSALREARAPAGRTIPMK